MVPFVINGAVTSDVQPLNVALILTLGAPLNDMGGT
jgi:hypothetical protein